jgi:hypothetical protein
MVAQRRLPQPRKLAFAMESFPIKHLQPGNGILEALGCCSHATRHTRPQTHAVGAKPKYLGPRKSVECAPRPHPMPPTGKCRFRGFHIQWAGTPYSSPGLWGRASRGWPNWTLHICCVESSTGSPRVENGPRLKTLAFWRQSMPSVCQSLGQCTYRQRQVPCFAPACSLQVLAVLSQYL